MKNISDLLTFISKMRSLGFEVKVTPNGIFAKRIKRDKIVFDKDGLNLASRVLKRD